MRGISLALALLLSFSSLASSFLHGRSASSSLPTLLASSGGAKCRSNIIATTLPNCQRLYASFGEEDDDDDDEDETIDDASLGDWRKFRASLIDGGLPGSSSSSSDASTDDKAPKEKKKKKSVASQNEALLEKQNKKLADEYRSGIWAHTVPDAEVGALLCRMPIEAEIYLGKSGGFWKEKLDLMLSLDSMDGRKRIEEVLDADTEITEAATLAQVDTWFAAADRMITRELKAITESGKIQNGILDPNDLNDNERLLLDKYMTYQSSWQEVCLVTSHNPESGCSQALVINRPISKSINKQIATLLLKGEGADFPHGFSDKLVQAFGTEAGVYMGGPDQQEEPALLIHGIANLPGAKELAPGTELYQGGWEAAVDGVLDGTYQPLDFRFFLGRQQYDPVQNPQRGNLLAKVQDGAYQPVACARSLALKQCLGLPKPLWHEVLELCGGELKAMSSIELRKRVDLQQ